MPSPNVSWYGRVKSAVCISRPFAVGHPACSRDFCQHTCRCDQLSVPRACAGNEVFFTKSLQTDRAGKIVSALRLKYRGVDQRRGLAEASWTSVNEEVDEEDPRSSLPPSLLRNMFHDGRQLITCMRAHSRCVFCGNPAPHKNFSCCSRLFEVPRSNDFVRTYLDTRTSSFWKEHVRR